MRLTYLAPLLMLAVLLYNFHVMPTVHVPEGCCVACFARSADSTADEQLTELARTETSSRRDPFFTRSLDLWDEASGKGGSIPLVWGHHTPFVKRPRPLRGQDFGPLVHRCMQHLRTGPRQCQGARTTVAAARRERMLSNGR